MSKFHCKTADKHRKNKSKELLGPHPFKYRDYIIGNMLHTINATTVAINKEKKLNRPHK